MAYMTYEELAREISMMTPAQREQTVTMFVPGVDEYYPCRTAMTDQNCDALDPNHIVLVPDSE